MAEAVNPAGETAATDVAKAPPARIEELTNNDADAVASVEARINNLFKPQVEAEEPEAEPAKEAEPVPEPEAEPEATDEAEEATEAEPETQPEELDLSTVPDTAEGLADAIGVTAQELSEHLKVTVKVNGKEQRVTLAEAVKGYQLDADYRAKTSDLAAKRKELDTERNAAAQGLQARARQLDELTAAVVAQLDLGPDDATLQKMLDPADPTYDPTGFLTAKTRRDSKIVALNNARNLRLADQRKAEAEAQANYATYRKEQQDALLVDNPELKDKSKLREFEDETRSSLTAYYGFADEEVDRFMQTFDARQVRIVRDAVKFRKMEGGKKKLEAKLKGIPKVTRPGTAKSSNERREAGDQAKRIEIRKGGKNAEAAAVAWLSNRV